MGDAIVSRPASQGDWVFIHSRLCMTGLFQWLAWLYWNARSYLACVAEAAWVQCFCVRGNARIHCDTKPSRVLELLKQPCPNVESHMSTELLHGSCHLRDREILKSVPPSSPACALQFAACCRRKGRADDRRRSL